MARLFHTLFFPSSRATYAAGAWLAGKVRHQARTAGVQQAARNLRKQGAPIEVALALLAGR